MTHNHIHDRELVKSREDMPRLSGQLAPREPVEVALQPGEQLNIFMGRQASMEASEANSTERFSVIDLRNNERNERGAIVYEGQELSPHLSYLITQPGVPIDWKAGTGYKGLRKGEVVDMGRTQDTVKNRFTFPDTASRLHFTVAVDNEGLLMIEDAGSTNGTSYETQGGVSEEIPVELGENEQRQKYLHELFALPDPQGKDRFGNDLDRRLKVTEQSKADAALAYRFADGDIKSIVGEYAREYHGAFREEQMANVLFQDEALRLRLGEYLLEKIEQNDIKRSLPSRFFRPDDMKNPNYVGYKKMTSQEYAAVLALSMLDGTFKAPSGDSDPIESEYGDIIRGQHRYAALRLLGIDRSPVPAAKIKVNR